jgi:hypothetical protein
MPRLDEKATATAQITTAAIATGTSVIKLKPPVEDACPETWGELKIISG